MKKGDKISKNFKLKEPIKTLDELVLHLKNNPSVFWRFKVTSSSFFLSWHLRTIINAVEAGYFWSIEKIN